MIKLFQPSTMTLLWYPKGFKPISIHYRPGTKSGDSKSMNQNPSTAHSNSDIQTAQLSHSITNLSQLPKMFVNQVYTQIAILHGLFTYTTNDQFLIIVRQLRLLLLNKHVTPYNKLLLYKLFQEPICPYGIRFWESARLKYKQNSNLPIQMPPTNN